MTNGWTIRRTSLTTSLSCCLRMASSSPDGLGMKSSSVAPKTAWTDTPTGGTLRPPPLVGLAADGMDGAACPNMRTDRKVAIVTHAGLGDRTRLVIGRQWRKPRGGLGRPATHSGRTLDGVQ